MDTTKIIGILSSNAKTASDGRLPLLKKGVEKENFSLDLLVDRKESISYPHFIPAHSWFLYAISDNKEILDKFIKVAGTLFDEFEEQENLTNQQHIDELYALLSSNFTSFNFNDTDDEDINYFTLFVDTDQLDNFFSKRKDQ